MKMSLLRRFCATALPFGLILLISLAACQSNKPAGLQAELLPKRGLQLSYNNVPIVRSSTLKFYSTATWPVFYDFSWIYQPVSHSPAMTKLALGGANSFVDGAYSMLKKQEGHLEFSVGGLWRRADSAYLSIQAGKIWLPAFAGGAITADNGSNNQFDLDAEGFPKSPIELDSCTIITISGPFVRVRFEFPDGDGQIRCTAQRKPASDKWNSAAPTLEINLTPGALAPGDSFERSFSIHCTGGTSHETLPEVVLDLPLTPAQAAWQVISDTLPLLPAPKSANLDPKSAFLLKTPSGQAFSAFDSLFAQAVGRLWNVPFAAYANIRAQQDRQLPAEGFRLDMKNEAVQIAYADDAGMRHAAHALAFLSRPQNGSLAVPAGTVNDYPGGAWRGIHMFVGPQALPFHQRMYERILLPLRMNKVVLQCEQTDWTSQPKIRNPITMPLKDLKAEAEFLRKHQVELIPLIQSFGHMEWFFENGQNLDLATNPEIPYTIDVKQERARKALESIWDEAVEITGAKTLHFGLDEVDMIGWAKRDPELITELWTHHLPFLDRLARKHQAEMMIWGDMLLGPGESIDFGNAESVQQAQQRRAAVPKGAYIADWHYKAEPEPGPYAPSLDILSTAGFRPVASTWFFPNNIRGFNLAALERGMGTLQTTWADFESSEANMLKYWPQFGAYILSLDYAWSGRKAQINELPYDANELWGKLFYRHPMPVKDQPGLLLGAPEKPMLACGPFLFKQLPAQEPGRKKIHIQPGGKATASGATLLLRSSSWGEENEIFAYATFEFQDGTTHREPIRYGVHLRAASDLRPVYAGYSNIQEQSAIYIPFPAKKSVKKIIFEDAHPYGQIALDGVTLIN